MTERLNVTNPAEAISDALRGNASNQGKSMMKSWLPLMIQTVALLGGGIAWSTAQEHRITIIEESQKNERVLIEQLVHTQELTIEQIRATQKTLDRLVTLEDFMHGMTTDEAEGYYRQQKKARPFNK